MARKYQHTLELLPEIKEMLAKGMTQKEIEKAFGLTGRRPIASAHGAMPYLKIGAEQSGLSLISQTAHFSNISIYPPIQSAILVYE